MAVIDFAEARQRHRVRAWWLLFADGVGAVMSQYDHDCFRRRQRARRVTVPWRRCPTCAFIFFYSTTCPLCIADAHGSV